MLTEKEQLLIMLKKLLLTEASVGQQQERIQQLEKQLAETNQHIEKLLLEKHGDGQVKKN